MTIVKARFFIINYVPRSFGEVAENKCIKSRDWTNHSPRTALMKVMTYQFRLYPKREEEEKLEFALEQSRKAYNCFLELLNNGERNINKIKKKLPEIRQRHHDMESVNSHSLYLEAYRLLENLKGQARRKREGKKVGRLRYKTPTSFKSFYFDRCGFKVERKNDRFGSLRLSKLGEIPIRLHREIHGKQKLAIIKRKSSGKWFAYIVAEVENNNGERENRKVVGIDLGLENLIVDSNGDCVENPHFHGKALKRLRRQQRRLSRRRRGSRNRERQRIRVARIIEHIANQRRDYLHKISRYYVDNYDIIAAENLNVVGMVSHPTLARSIMDASWGSLNRYLSYKAANAGKIFVQCEPRNTSILCSTCDKKVPKTLGDRVHDCPNCGMRMTRDYNASRNILRRGIEKIGYGIPESTLVDIRPLRQLVLTQAGWVKQEGLMCESKPISGENIFRSPRKMVTSAAISHERSAHKDG